MTAAWCEEITVMLENTNFEHYKHVDMWLVQLLKQQKARGFVLYSVLAGYGHRVSMSTAEHGVQKFGGCWLPPSPHERPLGETEKDNYIFKYSPPGMQEWVQDCRKELGRAPKREDVVESVLELELPSADAYADIGLYTQIQSAEVAGRETAACYDLDMHVPLTSTVAQDFCRPPEPRSEGRIGTDLEKLWAVHMAREERGEDKFTPLSRSAIQLGKWKYQAATDAVRGLQEESFPLSPQWQHFAHLCRADCLGAEGLHLAVFFSEGPGSGVGTSMDFFISSKELHEVCGLRPDAGAGGILEGFAHGRGRHLHVPLHARACGLRPWTKSRPEGACTCAMLGMAAEAHVDKVTTLARWLVQAAARCTERLNVGGLCPQN